LEGLSVQNVASITPEKLFTATKTVVEKLNMAAVVVENRLNIIATHGVEWATAKIPEWEKLSIVYLQNACSVTDTNILPEANDKGVRISKTWINTELSAIWVESIRIKSFTQAPTTLKISDIDGNVLWTKTTTIPDNREVKISVRKHFRKDIIFVTADASAISLFEYNCGSGQSCKPCAGKNEYLSIEGWTGQMSSNTGYLGVCARLDCIDIDLICQFLDRVGLAVLYQLGVEILAEWTSPNNRLNIIATHGVEWATAKIPEWEKLSIVYLQNEIDAIKQIMAADEYCYNCRGRVNAFPLLP
jgi:hypothetical protein